MIRLGNVIIGKDYRHFIAFSFYLFTESCARTHVMYLFLFFFLSRPTDSIRAMMIVWRLEMKITRTVLCCVVYESNVVHGDARTHVNSS